MDSNEKKATRGQESREEMIMVLWMKGGGRKNGDRKIIFSDITEECRRDLVMNEQRMWAMGRGRTQTWKLWTTGGKVVPWGELWGTEERGGVWPLPSITGCNPNTHF